MGRSPVKNALSWLLYAYGRTIGGFQRASPWDIARVNARRAGDMGYFMDRRERRRESLADLMLAFPDWTEDRARETLRELYRHMSETILDSLKFADHITRGNAEDLVETVGFEKLEAVPRQTGIIFVTGHFGHWEIMGGAASLIGYPVWSVARPLRDPRFARYVEQMRHMTGQMTIPARGSTLKALRLLQRGQNIAVLIDQDVRHGGIFVDFFGRPASTSAGPARMAIRTGAPVAFVYARRITGQNRFRIVLADVIRPQRTADRWREVRRITARYTKDLEQEVRRVPQEWLWVHRRWKTYPGRYAARSGGRQARPGNPTTGSHAGSEGV